MPIRDILKEALKIPEMTYLEKTGVVKMTASNKQIKVIAHPAKNRLNITIRGVADRTLIDELYTDVRFGVADLKPGFQVIVDLLECNLIHINGISTFKRIIDYLISKQVGRVVRIVKDSNLSYRQLVNFSKQIPYHQVHYAHHYDEAEKKLELMTTQ